MLKMWLCLSILLAHIAAVVSIIDCFNTPSTVMVVLGVLETALLINLDWVLYRCRFWRPKGCKQIKEQHNA